MLDVLLDTLLDTVKILPFLFLTYLLIEYLEHKAGEKIEGVIQRSGKLGPFFGGLLGVVPQCGFSTAASSLYSGRVITMGTLLAVFLSTSDEMLPIMISSRAKPTLILTILGVKLLIGVLFGFLIDLLYSLIRGKNSSSELHIEDICEQEHCHCEKGILRSALHHTLHIVLFLFLITFAINTAIYFLGEDLLASFILNKPVLGSLLAGLFGLIPNCAASVVITQLFLNGLISGGAMLSGLLSSAGVGILVLFRVNPDWKENVKITAMLYLISIGIGFFCLWIGLAI